MECDYKKHYTSKSQAKKASRESILFFKGKTKLFYYKCERCSDYHLTKVDPRTWERDKRWKKLSLSVA